MLIVHKAGIYLLQQVVKVGIKYCPSTGVLALALDMLHLLHLVLHLLGVFKSLFVEYLVI